VLLYMSAPLPNCTVPSCVHLMVAKVHLQFLLLQINHMTYMESNLNKKRLYSCCALTISHHACHPAVIYFKMTCSYHEAHIITFISDMHRWTTDQHVKPDIFSKPEDGYRRDIGKHINNNNNKNLSNVKQLNHDELYTRFWLPGRKCGNRVSWTLR
jgi:hypothetical protein